MFEAPELAFLRTILAYPEDDAPRLVFADWLDEHGEFARAEFIRLQIELYHATPEEDVRELQQREQELLRDNELRWNAVLSRQSAAKNRNSSRLWRPPSSTPPRFNASISTAYILPKPNDWPPVRNYNRSAFSISMMAIASAIMA
jgi:uncharacterized protein (TIGR02996 family)